MKNQPQTQLDAFKPPLLPVPVHAYLTDTEERSTLTFSLSTAVSGRLRRQLQMDPETPTPLRINTSRRLAFDSYFPLDAVDTDVQAEHESRIYDSDLASLPFPAPLTSLRANFRGTDFDCDDFLVQHQKHGQLDDLLQELRSLSGLLENELVKGVEGDYEAFIGLGRLDSRKVDDLRRGVMGVTESIKKVEAEVQQNLDDVEETLVARKVMRARKNLARKTLAISRGVDELAFLLDDKDLEFAVEAYERVQVMTRKTDMPEFESARFAELRAQLHTELRAAVASTTGDAKLAHAALVRRFAKVS